jgi:Questin oxidase-like
LGNVIDEALGVLADTGPEYDAFGGRIALANHGPMVIDALVALGRTDTLVEWAERYRPRLEPRPQKCETIQASEWRKALGDMQRARDWADFFENELAEMHWQDALNQWASRLAPGAPFGVHGMIRTAHAVRNLGRAETPERVRELAEGLAYWAAQYEELPRQQMPLRDMLPSEAILHLEQLDRSDRQNARLFTDAMRKLRDLPTFAAATDLIDTDDPAATLNDIAWVFAGVLIANNASVNPRGLSHSLTGGVATELMQPYLSRDVTEVMLRYGWQTAAAFYCSIVLEPPKTEVMPPSETIDEIVDEALQCPDEHAIKVTETCLRAYELRAAPVFPAAALSTTRRLNEVGVNLY